MVGKTDDKTSGGSGESREPGGRESKPKKPVNWMAMAALLAVSILLLVVTTQNRNRRRRVVDASEQQKQARMYSASALPDEKKEALEQLFAASGARVKVHAFNDEAVGFGDRWTSTYEAEVEFLANCRLQESETACWTTSASLHPFYLEYPAIEGGVVQVPSNRPQDGSHVTQFKQGERRAINGILFIGGMVTTRRDENGDWWTDGNVPGKESFLAKNRIPSGSESERPSDSVGQGARPAGK